MTPAERKLQEVLETLDQVADGQAPIRRAEDQVLQSKAPGLGRTLRGPPRWPLARAPYGRL